MIEFEYNNGRIEVNYRIKECNLVMTVDEMIAYINSNSEISDTVGFVVPFSVYEEVSKQAKRIDKAIEYKRARRRV
jgi:hypothetical protein